MNGTDRLKGYVAGGLVALAALALTACPDAAGPPTSTPLFWQAQVNGEAGWEHLTGLSEVVWIQGADTFGAAIALGDDEPGAVRPWHLHFNSCAEGGGIVGADADYPRLEIGEAGVDTVITSVPGAIDPAANYHVNVHLSEVEIDQIIACADVITGGGQAQMNVGGERLTR